MPVFIPTLVGLLPSLVWLLFYIREDESHPEPKKLIFYTFLSGAAMTFFVFGPQLLINDLLPIIGIEPYSVVSLFFLAGIEELFKFIAVYLTVSYRKEFDEPVDAMVYMIVAALGFAAVENVASILQGTSILLNTEAFEVTSLRFVGATLLHSLSSALVGYYWALAIIQKKGYFRSIMEGLGVATLLHAVFNSLIIIYGPETLLATIFLVTISFFVFNDFEKLKVIKE